VVEGVVLGQNRGREMLVDLVAVVQVVEGVVLGQVAQELHYKETLEEQGQVLVDIWEVVVEAKEQQDKQVEVAVGMVVMG
jgi:hypothetical protein